MITFNPKWLNDNLKWEKDSLMLSGIVTGYVLPVEGGEWEARVLHRISGRTRLIFKGSKTDSKNALASTVIGILSGANPRLTTGA